MYQSLIRAQNIYAANLKYTTMLKNVKNSVANI